MVVRRKCAPHNRAGSGEMDRELVRDGWMLDVGDAFRREQRREDVAVLAGFAGGKRGKRPNRQAEIETDAVEVAGADAGTGQYEQTVFGQQLPESRPRSGGSRPRPRSMMEQPPIFTTCSQGSSRIGRPPATGRVRFPSSRVWRASGEATCLMLLMVSDMAVVP